MKPIALTGQHEYDGQLFPLAVEVEAGSLDEACAWATGAVAELSRQAGEHGVVLVRGLPLAKPEDFDAVVCALGFPTFSYADSLSNEAPADVTIFLHHEMAQTPFHPTKLIFFCQIAAEDGGATPVCRSDVLWERLRAEQGAFAADCEARGLLYTNVMPGVADTASGMGRSWQSTLSVDNREAAEARLAKLGYTWQWQANGNLSVTTPLLPAVRQFGNGRTSFFNQLIAAFKGWKDTRNDPARAIRFGDGSPLNPADVAAASAIADELTFDILWRNGDIALMDNYVVMHGRRTFKGTRKVLASLVA